MNALRFTALFAVACSVAACSSAPDPGDREPTASESAAAVSSSPRDPCPTSAPRPGSTCTGANLVCSYGNDPRFGCRDILTCNSGKWDSVGDACSKKEPSCPARAPAERDGGLDTCTRAELGLSCVYHHEVYTCAPCEGNLCRAVDSWQTQTLATACPATVPNFGEKCTAAAGTHCNYNACASDGADNLGAAVTCTSGFWAQSTGTICF
jgi:hypothetical protein